MFLISTNSDEVFGEVVSRKCYDLSPDYVEYAQCGEQFHLRPKEIEGLDTAARIHNPDIYTRGVERGEFPW